MAKPRKIATQAAFCGASDQVLGGKALKELEQLTKQNLYVTMTVYYISIYYIYVYVILYVYIYTYTYIYIYVCTVCIYIYNYIHIWNQLIALFQRSYVHPMSSHIYADPRGRSRDKCMDSFSDELAISDLSW